MPVALVLGCSGQDGTFLCRRLVERGYSVIGVERQPAYGAPDLRPVTYIPLDLSRGTAELKSLLEQRRPDFIFHVAAVHASAGLAQYETVFEDMVAVNVTSMHAVLEYLRRQNPEARALYASSAKVFGAPLPPEIDEDTPRVSHCLYAVTKNTAGDVIRYYRDTYGCKASQLYLFNHESELRPDSFFIPKLVRALTALALGHPSPPERFATLDFHCDWGAADEYMEIAVDCLERAPAEDFVLATGRCLHARELVARLAVQRGICPDGILGEVAATDSGQPSYRVRTTKLEAKLGRVPRMQIEVLAQRLVDERVRRMRG